MQQESEKGKPREIGGRKATGPKRNHKDSRVTENQGKDSIARFFL